jgi:hypothetical protein
MFWITLVLLLVPPIVIWARACYAHDNKKMKIRDSIKYGCNGWIMPAVTLFALVVLWNFNLPWWFDDSVVSFDGDTVIYHPYGAERDPSVYTRKSFSLYASKKISLNAINGKLFGAATLEVEPSISDKRLFILSTTKRGEVFNTDRFNNRSWAFLKRWVDEGMPEIYQCEKLIEEYFGEWRKQGIEMEVKASFNPGILVGGRSPPNTGE